MAGIDRDGAGIDMYPEPTRAAIAAFDQAAAAIGETFERRIGEIAALDSQLGNGQGGARFYLSYQPYVDDVVPQLRQLVVDTRAYAANGIVCVDQYVQQDLENRGTVQNVGP